MDNVPRRLDRSGGLRWVLTVIAGRILVRFEARMFATAALHQNRNLRLELRQFEWT